MTVERSRGKPRPRVPRPGAHAANVDAVSPAPIRDPKTGRFAPGNQAHRLRSLRKRERELSQLSPEHVAPWLRPHVESLHREANELVAEVGGESSPSLCAFAGDAALAGALVSAFAAIAADPSSDQRTRSEALSAVRAWMRERRQNLLSLRAESRAGLPERRPPMLDLAARLAALRDEDEDEDEDDLDDVDDEDDEDDTGTEGQQ